jgi:N-methylhydantoinase A
MGGTTAKICLIDDGKPLFSRSFEVARQYRFLKGSGIPIRVPVIEMVEIGAGGGSIAGVDEMSRIQVGPASAGSEPGPACYGRGGTFGTVTDADLVIGRIRADRFAGGHMALDAAGASNALAAAVGAKLGLDETHAALGVVEIVEENMANAARVHAIECGKELSDRSMVAFGGAAPLHAARLAEKLGIATVIVPTGAGVGSAIGFLLAPISYEVARSHRTVLNASFAPDRLNRLRVDMRAEAQEVIRPAASAATFAESWTADMRYCGQGHELSIPVPAATLGPQDRDTLRGLFVAQYEAQFGRAIPELDVEILSWALRLAIPVAPMPPVPASGKPVMAVAGETVQIADPSTGLAVGVSLYERSSLPVGSMVKGPALIVEIETTTFVTAAFDATINGLGHLVMTRRAA